MRHWLQLLTHFFFGFRHASFKQEASGRVHIYLQISDRIW